MESIRDLKIADLFSLALSEDGKVYSWGSGLNGHLGHGDQGTQIKPKAIKFDFKDENKKIKQIKNKHRNMEGVEDLLSFHQFVKSSSKKNDPFMNQRKKQVESEILSHAFNFGSVNMIGDDFKQTGGKATKSLLKRTMDIAG